MENNKIIIKAPLYRGLIVLLKSTLLFVALLSIPLIIVTFIIKKGPELLIIAASLYFMVLILILFTLIYKKTTKTYIVIDEMAISKCKGNKIVKCINNEDIKSMHFEGDSFPEIGLLDRYLIYSNSNTRIIFFAKEKYVPEIEKLTQKKFREH